MSRKKNITKEDIEREYLGVSRNMNQASIALGVSKKTFCFYMKKLGIKGKDHKWNVASRDLSSFVLNRKKYIKPDVIIEMYLNSSLNIKMAARNIGCSVEFLRRSMKYYKIKAKKKSWNTDHPSGKQRLDITNEDRKEMVRLYTIDKNSVDQIADRYKLSMGAVRSILIVRGVEMRAMNEDTSIELILQNELKKRMIVFEKQKKIIGLPDIFIEPNICIFADGDYWHGNPEKFSSDTIIRSGGRRLTAEQIREKDKKTTRRLTDLGYRVFRFWESDIKRDVKLCVDIIPLDKTIIKPILKK